MKEGKRVVTAEKEDETEKDADMNPLAYASSEN